MTDIDRLQRHLEERARIATVEATPITSIVHRAKQRDRRRRAAIGTSRGRCRRTRRWRALDGRIA